MNFLKKRKSLVLHPKRDSIQTRSRNQSAEPTKQSLVFIKKSQNRSKNIENVEVTVSDQIAPSNPIKTTKLKLIKNIGVKNLHRTQVNTPQVRNITPINIDISSMKSSTIKFENSEASKIEALQQTIRNLNETVDQTISLNADLKENLRINKESLAAMIKENERLKTEISNDKKDKSRISNPQILSKAMEGKLMISLEDTLKNNCQTPNHLFDYSEKFPEQHEEEKLNIPDNTSEKDKIIEELQNEMKILEQDMNKELRIKTRKISSQQLQIQEFKTFLTQLVEKYQLPEQVTLAISDIQEKFCSEHLEDSVLYLSSNWSAGGMEEIFEKPSPRKNFKIDVQKAIDLPPETDSSEEEMPEPIPQVKIIIPKTEVEQKIDQILKDEENFVFENASDDDDMLDLNNDQFLSELGNILKKDSFDPTNMSEEKQTKSEQKKPFEYDDKKGPMEKAQIQKMVDIDVSPSKISEVNFMNLDAFLRDQDEDDEYLI